MRWYRETRIATPEAPLSQPEAETGAAQETAVELLQAVDVNLS
jgi:hypothetical protein